MGPGARGGRRRPADVAVAGLLVAGLLLVLARLYVFDLRTVDVEGMAPGLVEGDLLVLSRLAEPVAGDVVVHALGADGERFVKRVVAADGEQVEITDGVLRVDGRPLAVEEGERTVEACIEGRPQRVDVVTEARGGERWWAVPGGPDQPALRLEEGELYVLGDHRGRSRDARTWGPIRRSEVHGVVVAVWRRSPCGPAPRAPME